MFEQAIRNDIDLKCMAVPPKYRKLGNFYQYYNGELKAPYLTVVIGGNHEASNHMDELYVDLLACVSVRCIWYAKMSFLDHMEAG